MPAFVLKLTGVSPDTGAQQAPAAAGPLLRGTDDSDHLCGNCGFVIASGMAPGQRVAIETATGLACGADNELPPELRR
jgi:hypothetical protein